ncbi:MAG TPA: inorganic diphosphatase [Dongiaceae bacterium]|nr:inorganic diphosphatase [Dongiaceae bacterium]
MTNLLSLPAFASQSDVHVVVETPRHVQAKFKYEPELGVFMPSRALTLGLSYPYDWGFVPSTEAPDGDPLDALVPHQITASPGDTRDVRDLPASLLHQGAKFFTAATAGTGKRLKFLGWRDPRAALAAIRKAQRAFERSAS